MVLFAHCSLLKISVVKLLLCSIFIVFTKFTVVGIYFYKNPEFLLKQKDVVQIFCK